MGERLRRPDRRSDDIAERAERDPVNWHGGLDVADPLPEMVVHDDLRTFASVAHGTEINLPGLIECLLGKSCSGHVRPGGTSMVGALRRDGRCGYSSKDRQS